MVAVCRVCILGALLLSSGIRPRQAASSRPAVTRESYVSPAVVEQYLEGRTIDDFRPRHLRVVNARELGLSPEEQAMLSLLRSWRIRRSTDRRA